MKTLRSLTPLACAALASSFLFAAVGDADPDWPAVAEMSERRLQEDARDEKAWAELVRARLKSGDVKRAEKALGDWRGKIATPLPAAEQLRAEIAFAREDFAGAIEAARRYAELAPQDVAGWTALANYHAAVRALPEAVEAVTRALKIAPDARKFAVRADYRVRLHDWRAAAEDVSEANRLDATDPATQQLVPAFEKMAEWIKPISGLDAAISKEPRNARLRLDRAEWLIGVGFVDAGADDVGEAVKLSPDSLRARIWKGVLAWERHSGKDAGKVMTMRLEAVTAEFEAQLKTLDASSDHEARAKFLLNNHQPLLALEETNEVRGSPTKALALFELGRLPEALVAAREAVESNPREASGWFALARVEIENGNISDAVDALDRSLTLRKTKEATDLRKAVVKRLGNK